MALLPVIKYDGPPRMAGGEEAWLVWKYPSESVPLGSRLVVVPGQEVVFINEGRLGDRFGPGSYTLDTRNIPLLRKLVNLPFGGDSPFAAEVYFVNKIAKLDLKWGTADPIRLKDPMYDIIVPLRAYGQFGLKIEDAGVFLFQLVGALHPDEITLSDRVTAYFRGGIISKVKDTIAALIVRNQVSVLELAARLEEISDECRERVQGEFNRFGLTVLNFFVESINYAEDDPSVIALRDALARKAGKLIDAQADKGEIDTLGDERYKMKRSFDTMQKAVESKGGPGGALMDLGIGLVQLGRSERPWETSLPMLPIPAAGRPTFLVRPASSKTRREQRSAEAVDRGLSRR